MDRAGLAEVDSFNWRCKSTNLAHIIVGIHSNIKLFVCLFFLMGEGRARDSSLVKRSQVFPTVANVAIRKRPVCAQHIRMSNEHCMILLGPSSDMTCWCSFPNEMFADCSCSRVFYFIYFFVGAIAYCMVTIMHTQSFETICVETSKFF